MRKRKASAKFGLRLFSQVMSTFITGQRDERDARYDSTPRKVSVR